ncbi:hypothetical protein AKJ65_02075 [candidate division MSBL1 archaeon SCGC-AAA259E19]|uniref:ABC transmembrane type-1 domain-containing protein n=1 Tax=candidate division MSBL1 archaeon SCGC-AAA259E19 TaxID=1698264 RepID=A0A133UM36_9EURY|nr:hypothetical protein AKJ65_02075 [candidate division MSBL1 archaeon SCGC-AAA259E19]
MEIREGIEINRRTLMLLSVLITIIVVFGFIGPKISKNPAKIYGARYGAPSWEHPLGLDFIGRDLFARFCAGFLGSLKIGAICGLIGALLSVVIGGFSAYRGGIMDKGANLTMNVILSFPIILILFAVASFLQTRTILGMGVLMGLFIWPGQGRAIRGQVLSLKERKFVDLSRMTGLGSVKILFAEVIPNILHYIGIVFVISMQAGIIIEANLSFLGIGPTNTITLGRMLYLARVNGAVSMWGAWWAFLPAGIMIGIFCTVLIFLQESMEEIFNPRAAGR